MDNNNQVIDLSSFERDFFKLLACQKKRFVLFVNESIDYLVDDFADIKNICKTFLINTQSYDEENEYDLEKTIVQINKEKIKRFTSYNTNECIEMVNNLKFTDTIEQTESNYSKAFKDLEKDNSIITLAVIIKPSSQQLNPVRYNNVMYYFVDENTKLFDDGTDFFINKAYTQPITRFSPYPKIKDEIITTTLYQCQLEGNRMFNEFKIEYTINDDETKTIIIDRDKSKVRIPKCKPNSNIKMKIYPVRLKDIFMTKEVNTLNVMKILSIDDKPIKYDRIREMFIEHRYLNEIKDFNEFKICLIGTRKYPFLNECSMILDECVSLNEKSDPLVVKEYTIRINDSKNLKILNSIDLDENKEDKQQIDMVFKLVSGQLQENKEISIKKLDRDDPIHICILNIDICKVYKELDSDIKPHLSFLKKVYLELIIAAGQKEKNEYFKIKPLITVNNFEEINESFKNKIKRFRSKPLKLYEDHEVRLIIEKIANFFDVDQEYVFPYIETDEKNITVLLILYHSINSHFVVRFGSIYKYDPSSNSEIFEYRKKELLDKIKEKKEEIIKLEKEKKELEEECKKLQNNQKSL